MLHIFAWALITIFFVVAPDTCLERVSNVTLIFQVWEARRHMGLEVHQDGVKIAILLEYSG